MITGFTTKTAEEKMITGFTTNAGSKNDQQLHGKYWK